MSYQITWEPDGVLVSFAAPVTARDLIGSVRNMHADSRFDEGSYVINQLPDEVCPTLTEDALIELAALNYGAYTSHPNSRIVFVTTDAALGQLIESVLMRPELASYQVKAFNSLVAARDWLEAQPNLHIMSSVMGLRLR
ncbi:MAG: hypothetical protein LBE62_12130 [Azonexus sp.]|jgi:hypothetical protein|nr:hypothetical protein [Azonexus sp.]